MEIAERVEQQDDGKGNSHHPKDQSTAHESISFLTTSIFTTWGDDAGSQALLPSAPPVRKRPSVDGFSRGLRALLELIERSSGA